MSDPDTSMARCVPASSRVAQGRPARQWAKPIRMTFCLNWIWKNPFSDTLTTGVGLSGRLRQLSAHDWEKTAEHGEYSHYSVFIMFRRLALHDFWDALQLRTAAMLSVVAELSDVDLCWLLPNGVNPIAWMLWHIDGITC